ncbi:MAG: hypothetical protein WD035_11135 [Balneolaceae bacterium]
MLKLEDTKLEVFTFGEEPDDKFYCLVNLKVSPDGLNLSKLKLSDPRNFDQLLSEAGCLVMLTQDEMNELIGRGELKAEDLHSELYELCKKEGIIH